MRSRGLPLIFAFAAALAAAPASAQDVAVASFSGSRATLARRAVVQAAGELGLQVVRADAEPALLVTGRTRGRGRSARLRLTVEDAAGQRLARQVLRLRSRSALRRGATRTLRRAVRRLERAEVDAPRESPPRRRAGEADEEARPDAATGPVRPIVEVLAGAHLAGRVARFEMEDGDRRGNEVAYPELSLDAEVRPWRDEEGVERGLVFRGRFGHAVGLRSVDDGSDEPVATTFFRVYGEVGLLFEVDPSAELGLGVGFGWDAYAFGEQSRVILPSAEYAVLRPNLRGRFRIEEELAVLDVTLGYRGVLARGALSEHFGEEGEAQGFDAVARFGGSLDVGLAYGLEAGLQTTFHFFRGEARTEAARDGVDVGLWLGARIGFAIR